MEYNDSKNRLTLKFHTDDAQKVISNFEKEMVSASNNLWGYKEYQISNGAHVAIKIDKPSILDSPANQMLIFIIYNDMSAESTMDGYNLLIKFLQKQKQPIHYMPIEYFNK